MEKKKVPSPILVLSQKNQKTQDYLIFTQTKIFNRTLDECEASNSEIQSCILTRMKTSRCDIVNSSFDKSTLRDTVINKSMIWNSKLYDTTIVNCEVLNCKLINCEIIHAPPSDSDQERRVLDRVLRRHRDLPDELPCCPQYVECNFGGCKLQNIKMRWSKMNGGSSTNCSVLFSDFQDSKVEKPKVSVGSYYKNCEHDGRLIENQAPLPLTVLPIEVRKKIFSLVTKWIGRTPPLIIALRPETTMYKEALGVLVRDNYFPLKDLSRLDELILPNMSNNTINSIQRLSVSGFTQVERKWKTEKKTKNGTKTKIEIRAKIIERGNMVNCLLEEKKLPYLQHLRDLQIVEIHDEQPDEFEARIKAFIELAKRYSLEKISIKLEYMETYEDETTPSQKSAYAKCDEIMNAKIWDFNIQLGVAATNNRLSDYRPIEPNLFRHPGYRYRTSGTIWTWQAPKDCNLQWNNMSEICLRSKAS